MGRPKKDPLSPPATRKIEESFWRLLSDEGYDNITILRLTQDTGLNRNTIYYHYDNVEDIARKAVEHLMDSETVSTFISQLLSGEKDLGSNPQFVPRIQKLLLLAESDSPFLQSFVKATLLQTWFHCFCIDASKLSASDWMVLDFISSGITSILGSKIFPDHPEIISLFPTTEIGKAALHTLQKLSQPDISSCSREISDIMKK